MPAKPLTASPPSHQYPQNSWDITEHKMPQNILWKPAYGVLMFPSSYEILISILLCPYLTFQTLLPFCILFKDIFLENIYGDGFSKWGKQEQEGIFTTLWRAPSVLSFISPLTSMLHVRSSSQGLWAHISLGPLLAAMSSIRKLTKLLPSLSCSASASLLQVSHPWSTAWLPLGNSYPCWWVTGRDDRPLPTPFPYTS